LVNKMELKKRSNKKLIKISIAMILLSILDTYIYYTYKLNHKIT